MQVTRVQRVGTPQTLSLVDAACDCPFYAIPFYSRRTILSPVTYLRNLNPEKTMVIILGKEISKYFTILKSYSGY